MDSGLARNDARTCVRILATPLARVLQIRSRPIKIRGHTRPSREGAGKTGCALHPRSHVQRKTKNAHEQTGSAETLRPSLRNGLRLIFVLSPARPGLVCHRRPQETRASRELDAPAIGASGPHDFTVRIGAVRPRQKHATPPRPSHPMPNVQDDHDTSPLRGPGRERIRG